MCATFYFESQTEQIISHDIILERDSQPLIRKIKYLDIKSNLLRFQNIIKIACFYVLNYESIVCEIYDNDNISVYLMVTDLTTCF